jgi:hypothetical protein
MNVNKASSGEYIGYHVLVVLLVTSKLRKFGSDANASRDMVACDKARLCLTNQYTVNALIFTTHLGEV